MYLSVYIVAMPVTGHFYSLIASCPDREFVLVVILSTTPVSPFTQYHDRALDVPCHGHRHFMFVPFDSSLSYPSSLAPLSLTSCIPGHPTYLIHVSALSM